MKGGKNHSFPNPKLTQKVHSVYYQRETANQLIALKPDNAVVLNWLKDYYYVLCDWWVKKKINIDTDSLTNCYEFNEQEGQEKKQSLYFSQWVTFHIHSFVPDPICTVWF